MNLRNALLWSAIAPSPEHDSRSLDEHIAVRILYRWAYTGQRPMFSSLEDQ